MRHLVCGYYGMGNFGDDLFVKVLSETARTSRASVVFLCPPIPGVRAHFAYPAWLARAYVARRGLGRLVRLAVGVAWQLWAGRVTLGGGSVVTGLDGTRRAQHLVNRVLRRRWDAVGVSIGPYQSDQGRRQALRLIESCARVDVRDERSMRELGLLGAQTPARHLGDLAGCATLPDPVAEDSRLLLIPCSSMSDEWHDELARAVAQCVTGRPGVAVTVASLNSHPEVGDDRLAARITDRLVGAGVEAHAVSYTALGVAGTLSRIAGSRWVVSGRLHGGIVAFLMGIPAITVEYHQKVTDFVDEAEVPEELRLHPGGLQDTPSAVGALLDGRWAPDPAVVRTYRARADVYRTWAVES